MCRQPYPICLRLFHGFPPRARDVEQVRVGGPDGPIVYVQVGVNICGTGEEAGGAGAPCTSIGQLQCECCAGHDLAWPPFLPTFRHARPGRRRRPSRQAQRLTPRALRLRAGGCEQAACADCLLQSCNVLQELVITCSGDDERRSTWRQPGGVTGRRPARVAAALSGCTLLIEGGALSQSSITKHCTSSAREPRGMSRLASAHALSLAPALSRSLRSPKIVEGRDGGFTLQVRRSGCETPVARPACLPLRNAHPCSQCMMKCIWSRVAPREALASLPEQGWWRCRRRRTARCQTQAGSE